MASLARENDLNANQLFYWRKQYRAGQLCEDRFTERSRSVQLLPISVADDEPAAAKQIKTPAPRLTMNIEIPDPWSGTYMHSRVGDFPIASSPSDIQVYSKTVFLRSAWCLR
jgi:hypothetical protein